MNKARRQRRRENQAKKVQELVIRAALDNAEAATKAEAKADQAAREVPRLIVQAGLATVQGKSHDQGKAKL